MEGLEISGKANFSAVMEHIDSIVQGIYMNETPEAFKQQGIDVFVNETGAKFIDAHTLQIGSDVI